MKDSEKKQTILVVEDDSSIRLGLEDTLRAKGYSVESTASGLEALSLVGRKSPDLVVLDIMLPDMEGFEVCRQLKERHPDQAVIMLTARSAELDRVRGLELGADDYITKPFSLMELLARVQAVLRRVKPRDPESRPRTDRVTVGDLEIDFRRHEAKRKGKVVPLSDRAFLVLEVLARHRGEVVSRELLLEEAWGYDRHLNTRTVDNHVVKIRQAIEEDPEQPQHLLTVWGVGYKLVDAEG
ncbi:MAG: response regulator transcription factor [bacterium]